MQFDFSSQTADKVVGNLPYNITSPLLFKLLKPRQVPSKMVFMVQREVAERICAAPGGKDYGVLSVVCSYRTRVRRVLKAPPSSFWPQPDVHSAAVELVTDAESWLNPQLEAYFFPLVEAAFSQRRKTLTNSLRSLGVQPHRLALALIEAGVDSHARAEQLSIDDFRRLTMATYDEG